MLTHKTKINTERLKRKSSDIIRLMNEIQVKQFDVTKRYDLKYIIEYSIKYEWNKSRLNKALDLINLKVRKKICHQIKKRESKKNEKHIK